MYLLPYVLPLFALSVLAGKLTDPVLHRRHFQNRYRRGNENATTHGLFKLQDMYKGQDFLDRWDFFSAEDPTHGNVNYQSRENAVKKGLAFVQDDGTTVLAVDDFSDVPVGGRRDSVRISSKKTYNQGLFIADIFAMPHGCSVWPAYWSVGPNWPSAGEIDILEGVHEGPNNQYVLHSSEGCMIKDTFGPDEVTSNFMHNICTSSGNDNRGCGFWDPDPKSYGGGFNAVGGGVLAHLWDHSGIKVWRFTRDAIPLDIQTKQPSPSLWGTPAALFPSTQCDMEAHFFEHSLVLDTTLCGDFAGPTYQNSGCPGTCAEAIANKEKYKSAKWKINYIAYYDTIS